MESPFAAVAVEGERTSPAFNYTAGQTGLVAGAGRRRGSGPVGLALAIELGMRDIRTLVIERNDRVGYAPRAKPQTQNPNSFASLEYSGIDWRRHRRWVSPIHPMFCS